jgi:hypothetical protein
MWTLMPLTARGPIWSIDGSRIVLLCGSQVGNTCRPGARYLAKARPCLWLG